MLFKDHVVLKEPLRNIPVTVSLTTPTRQKRRGGAGKEEIFVSFRVLGVQAVDVR